MNKYFKYKIHKSNESFDKICNVNNVNKEFKLLPQQEFIAEYLYDNRHINGLLIFHQLGSGKTCTAITICEKFKHELQIIIVCPASLMDNFRNELRSKCGNYNYMSQDNTEKLINLKPSNKEYINIINDSNELIKKKYKIYSFQKFIKLINTTDLKLNNTLLIIDEIQGLISSDGIFYKSLLTKINKTDRSLLLVLMSATPMFDTPHEIALTLNLLRPSTTFPIGDEFSYTFLRQNKKSYDIINLDLFKSLCKNLISYYRGDLPISYPEMKLQVLRCKMSDFQYDQYKLAIKKEKRSTKKIGIINKTDNIFKLSNNFYIGPRIVSNISFPNEKTGEEGFLSIDAAFQNMRIYSIKFHIIYNKVQESKGPVFIYSQFLDTGGLKSLIKYFEYKGYKNFNSNNVGENRFAIWSGSETLKYRDKVKKIFNEYENKNGSLIKILFGSPAAKEGISLLRVNQVHVLEPYWNMSRIKQIIGRAIRFCSHKDIPEDERYVEVYIYLSTYPGIESIDEYIWNIAKKKI